MKQKVSGWSDWLGFCAPLVINCILLSGRRARVMAFQEPRGVKVALVSWFSFLSVFFLCTLPPANGPGLVYGRLLSDRAVSCITWSDSSWCSAAPVASSERPSSFWGSGLRWWPRRTPSSGPSASVLNIPRSNRPQSDETREDSKHISDGLHITLLYGIVEKLRVKTTGVSSQSMHWQRQQRISLAWDLEKGFWGSFYRIWGGSTWVHF